MAEPDGNEEGPLVSGQGVSAEEFGDRLSTSTGQPGQWRGGWEKSGSFAAQLDQQLDRLHCELKQRTYRPQPVRQVQSQSRANRGSFARSESRRFMIGYVSKHCSIGWNPSSSRCSMKPTSDTGEGDRQRMPSAKCGERFKADGSGLWTRISRASWIRLHTAPWFMKVVRIAWLLIDYFDSQAFTPALPDQHGFSSPRFTRCNTVCRETPSFTVVSSIGRYSGGACCTMRARSSSVIRICQGAPGVTCSPAMKPSASQR